MQRALEQPREWKDPIGGAVGEDYGVECQVDSEMMLVIPKLRIGIVSSEPAVSMWKLFTERFGTVAWHQNGAKEGEKAKEQVKADEVDLVLIEGVRLGKHHPVWATQEVRAVMSLNPW